MRQERAASLPQVRVQATDYHYDMPATMPAGLVAITQTNSGAQPHQVVIRRLKAGVSDQQMVDAFPGEEAEIGFLTAPDGMAHYAKGMYHFFTVARTSASVMSGQLVLSPEGT